MDQNKSDSNRSSQQTESTFVGLVTKPCHTCIYSTYVDYEWHCRHQGISVSPYDTCGLHSDKIRPAKLSPLCNDCNKCRIRLDITQKASNADRDIAGDYEWYCELDDRIAVRKTCVHYNTATAYNPYKGRYGDINIKCTECINCIWNNKYPPVCSIDNHPIKDPNLTGACEKFELDEPDVCEALDIDKATLERLIKSKDMRAIIEGVGPDSPLITNEKGGVSSESPYRMDLLPMLSLLDVSKVLKRGFEKYGKYGKDNWKLLSVEDHINHVLVHLAAHTAGDTQDKHLSNAACRVLFALEVFILSQQNIQAANKNKTKQKENESKT